METLFKKNNKSLLVPRTPDDGTRRCLSSVVMPYLNESCNDQNSMLFRPTTHEEGKYFFFSLSIVLPFSRLRRTLCTHS